MEMVPLSSLPCDQEQGDVSCKPEERQANAVSAVPRCDDGRSPAWRRSERMARRQEDNGYHGKVSQCMCDRPSISFARGI
eukprot:755494-Hanusia_phi.AAC.10